MQAHGTFEVKLEPQAATPGNEATGIGRLVLDKRFHGDLDAASRGEMLALRTPTEGSAGYVAIEHVAGTLLGRHGSFALQHSGSMNRGAQQLSISVIADSGTDGLAGLAGTMTIRIDAGVHHYTLDFSLP